MVNDRKRSPRSTGMAMNLVSGLISVMDMFAPMKALMRHKSKFRKSGTTKRTISKEQRKARRAMQKLSRKINRRVLQHGTV